MRATQQWFTLRPVGAPSRLPFMSAGTAQQVLEAEQWLQRYDGVSRMDSALRNTLASLRYRDDLKLGFAFHNTADLDALCMLARRHQSGSKPTTGAARWFDQLQIRFPSLVAGGPHERVTVTATPLGVDPVFRPADAPAAGSMLSEVPGLAPPQAWVVSAGRILKDGLLIVAFESEVACHPYTV